MKKVTKKQASGFIEDMQDYRTREEARGATFYIWRGKLHMQPWNGQQSEVIYKGEDDASIDFDGWIEFSDLTTKFDKVNRLHSFLNDFVEDFNSKIVGLLGDNILIYDFENDTNVIEYRFLDDASMVRRRARAYNSVNDGNGSYIYVEYNDRKKYYLNDIDYNKHYINRIMEQYN